MNTTTDTNRYVMKIELLRRGPNSPAEPVAPDQLLLVAEKAVANWHEPEGDLGSDYVTLYPAVYGGEKAWLMHRSWSPGVGYSASGAGERVLAFEEGAQLLLQRGAFSHLWEDGEDE